MRRSIILLACCAFGCGSGEAANFDGSWNIAGMQLETCGSDQPTGRSTSWTLVLQQVPGSTNDLTWNDGLGCIVHYELSGDTAILSGVAQTCYDVTDGGAIEKTFTGYTLATSDGQHLTLDYGYTEQIEGQTCTVTEVGSGSR